MLASTLNAQLGWGAKWKVRQARMTWILSVLPVMLESRPLLVKRRYTKSAILWSEDFRK